MKKKIFISVVVGSIVLLTILGVVISYKIKKDKENEVYRCLYCESSLKNKE